MGSDKVILDRETKRLVFSYSPSVSQSRRTDGMHPQFEVISSVKRGGFFFLSRRPGWMITAYKGACILHAGFQWREWRRRRTTVIDVAQNVGITIWRDQERKKKNDCWQSSIHACREMPKAR